MCRLNVINLSCPGSCAVNLTNWIDIEIGVRSRITIYESIKSYTGLDHNQQFFALMPFSLIESNLRLL